MICGHRHDVELSVKRPWDECESLCAGRLPSGGDPPFPTGLQIFTNNGIKDFPVRFYPLPLARNGLKTRTFAQNLRLSKVCP